MGARGDAATHRRMGAATYRGLGAAGRVARGFRLVACGGWLLASGCSDGTRRSATEPAPYELVEVPVAGHTLRVPRGFAVEVYAENLPGARWLALGPGGVPHLSVPEDGRVVRLPDADGDGRADSAVIVATGLRLPHGLAFRGDTLYVADEPRVVRLVPGIAAPQVVVPNLPCCGVHWSRTIAFGPDGRLYIAAGSSCNICTESDPRRAAITRYNADGTGEEIFARGLRNSVGIAFHPTTGELWATNNDRDWLGDELPPERINIVRAGGFYGWPQCYLPNTPNPEYAGADCSQVEPPAITFQAHSAPLGITFYAGTQFPAEYRGDAFMAYHGSWNRTVPTGYKVVHVNVVNGRPESIRDFVTGFQSGEGLGWIVRSTIGFLLPSGMRAWGRPVALLELPDGSLLFSDDDGGRVFRVRHVGAREP